MSISTQTKVIAPRPAAWTDSVTLDQADPALGIQAISLSLAGTLYSQVSVESLELAPSTFVSTDTASVSLQRPDGTGWLQAQPFTKTIVALAAADRVLDFAGPAGRSLLDGTGSASNVASYGPASAPSGDVALLIGTGTVTLPVTASARVSATGPGNMVALFASRAGASVSTRYETEIQPGGDTSSGSEFTFITPPPLIASSPYTVTTAAQVVRLDDAMTGGSTVLTLEGFDPSLGKLRSVLVTIKDVDSRGTVAAENLDSLAGPVTISQTASVRLTRQDGSALAQSAVTGATVRADLAAFDGTADFLGASGTQQATASVSAYQSETYLTGTDAASFVRAAPVTIEAFRYGATAIDGPGNLQVSTSLQAGATVEVSYTYQVTDLRYTDIATQTSGTDATDDYHGPVGYLQHQYIWSGQDAVAIAASVPNAFLKGGTAGDALQAMGGNNVLDGGGGSNFLVGGDGTDGGADTFFVDGGGGLETWSTLVHFHMGDSATIFGFHPGTSTLPFTASDGADGYKGLTVHSELNGTGTGVLASMTFAGLTQADADAHFSITSGTLQGGPDYLLIQYDH